MIKPSPKLLVIGGVYLVAVVVLFTFTIMAALKVRDEPAEPPRLHATVGDVRLALAPWDNCTDEGMCAVNTCPVKLAVPAGRAIVISLPESLYRLPWAATFQRFDTKTGQYVGEEVQPQNKPTPGTFVLKSTPERPLVTVEFQQLAIAKNSDGVPDLAIRYRWCIDTRDYTKR